MFICFICQRSFLTVNSLIKHLKQWHALYDGVALKLQCFNTNCSYIYQTYSGYRRHIRTCILNKENHSKSNVEFGRRVCEVHEIDTDINNFNQSLVSHNLRTSLNDYSSSFISTLYAHNLPNWTIQKVIDASEDLLKVFVNNAIDKEQMQTAFLNFNSKHKRRKFFKQHIVEPVEVSLGTRFDQKWNKERHVYEQVPVTSTFTYIPILDTLKFLLANDSYKQLICHKNDNKNISIINNFYHGSIYKNTAFFKENKNAFQLQLYFDEFETVNPLGSKTGGHKLGAIYMIVRNIPSYFNSKLQNIHLVALFYSSDIKNFGINLVLDVIVRDIKILENSGVYDSTSQNYVKGTLIGLSHDNLGGNMLFGMVESFSATHFCRICIADKGQSQTLCFQDDRLLRTDELYEMHCKSPRSADQVHTFGVKFKSSLNNLNFFKLCNNPSVDIMHDLLEGVVQLEIKLLLKFLISHRLITITEINNRLKSFNFGKNENCNKPSPICLDKPGHSIGQRAAQTLCLIKYIPLILSDIIPKIPEEHIGKFELIRLLLKVINIVFSPIITQGMISHLSSLIMQHHKLIQLEYTLNLTPKHHLMTHYPHVIKKMGPLITLSSMRFEAKHGYFKNIIHSLKNYKAICKTLSFCHQEYMWHQWKNINLTMAPKFGCCKHINLNNAEYREKICSFLKTTLNYSHSTEMTLLVTNSVIISSTCFQKHMFVTNERDILDYPIFSEIIEIFIIDGNPYMVCKNWRTLDFNIDYQGYEIESASTINISVLDFKKLQHLVSYELHHPYHKQDYNKNVIIPKYEII